VQWARYSTLTRARVTSCASCGSPFTVVVAAALLVVVLLLLLLLLLSPAVPQERAGVASVPHAVGPAALHRFVELLREQGGAAAVLVVR
jgi:hypothetical protein